MRREEAEAVTALPCPCCGNPGEGQTLWQLSGLCYTCVGDWFSRPEHEAGAVIPGNVPLPEQFKRYEAVTKVWLASMRSKARAA